MIDDESFLGAGRREETTPPQSFSGFCGNFPKVRAIVSRRELAEITNARSRHAILRNHDGIV